MDRVGLTIRRRGDETPLDGKAPCIWDLDAEHAWLIEGAEADVRMVEDSGISSCCQRLSPSMLEVRFGNAVGRYQAGPLGTLVVRTGKWTEADYNGMLEDIADRAVALPFAAGAASSLPYARSDADAPDVIYHSFVWLRHVVLEHSEAPLASALQAILREPHRRMERVDRVVPTERALHLTPRAIDDILQGRGPMMEVARGQGLGGGRLMPAEVSESIPRSTVDTAENRFVKQFILECGYLIDVMRERARAKGGTFGVRVRSDCDRIEEALWPLRQSAWWNDVGVMSFFPASSTVLQRSPAYREVLRNHILMRLASRALPLDSVTIEHLLEVRDVASLYELWCAFAVIEAFRKQLGQPVDARRVEHGELGATVRWGLQARWQDGTQVAYNHSFTRGQGFYGKSWSLTLRPDVAVWLPQGPAAGLHLLDAKFKLDGPLPGNTEEPADTKAKIGDIHKMHTYRDAIPEARTVWVLYPGSTFRVWCEDGSVVDAADDLPLDAGAVGAIPCRPGGGVGGLERLVARWGSLAV